MQQHLCAIEAVVDIHETSRLLAVAPNFDLVLPGYDSHRYLARYRCRCLFAPPIPRSVRAIDVVIARDASLDAEIFAKVAAQALGEQLLPSIAILAVGGIGV